MVLLFHAPSGGARAQRPGILGRIAAGLASLVWQAAALAASTLLVLGSLGLLLLLVGVSSLAARRRTAPPPSPPGPPKPSPVTVGYRVLDSRE